MIPFPFPPPVIQAPSRVLPLNEAVEQVLQDFDAEDPAVPLRDPAVRRADRPSLQWLRAAALSDLPRNPFRKGTRSSAEAEILLALLNSDRSQAGTVDPLLQKLKIQEPGTAMALWRWARRQERLQPWNPATRRSWEDKLLAKGVPSMLNGYALRHALCWALAEQDEARFAALKAAWAQESPSLFASFQGLFGWFGAISPELRLWRLPGLEYQDRRLDLLLAADGSRTRRIWISPDIGSWQHLPAGTAWIVPSATATNRSNETSLNPAEQASGTSLSATLTIAQRQAYFAPSRTDFETLGLVFFPILIELDPKGAIQGIRMGDAAPPKP
ncbi:MAG: hypothetical protein IPQ13_13630 [Holophagaceae bacterium]|nr:hypothetical protein [Holophagaceae bacterium]